MRVPPQRLDDPATRSVVEHPFTQGREVAPCHDDRDLRGRTREVEHVALQRARDVPVPAFDHVERERQTVIDPLGYQIRCLVRIERRVHRAHVRGTKRERVTHGSQDRFVEFVDQDHGGVRAPHREADDGAAILIVREWMDALRMVPDQRHPNMFVREQGVCEAGSCPGLGEPLGGRHVVGHPAFNRLMSLSFGSPPTNPARRLASSPWPFRILSGDVSESGFHPGFLQSDALPGVALHVHG